MNFNELTANMKKVHYLCKGGQKHVYRGEDVSYGDVVIKVFNEEADPRAEREFELGKIIKHPYSTQLLETGVIETPDGDRVYFIEKYQEGTNLREVYKTRQRLSFGQAVKLLECGLSLICYLETLSIVHRDIKPENIIMLPDGNYCFIDFGIARAITFPSLTSTSAWLGPHTAGYAAPEQFNNSKPEIDSRADLFSLAIVIYEGLTGSNPFISGASSSLEVLMNTASFTPGVISIPGDTQFNFASLLASMANPRKSKRPKDAKQAENWFQSILPTLVF